MKTENFEPESQLSETYARMQKMGVPMSAIKHKMEQDGVGGGPSDKNALGVFKPHRCDCQKMFFFSQL